ncbi:MAG: group II intron reverse transcriptase/maturase [Clostridium sp.]|nr:group II intron reverse transcriptase/maturase [Clostridium sp.]
MTKQKKLRHLEYYDLQECFDSLYAKSKQGEVFTKLMDLISGEENIRLAYRNIKRNSGSHTSGTDNLNIEDIEKLSAEKLTEIIQRKFRYYKPNSVRRVEIPKPNGKTRPLGIPTIIDRLIQQCILQVLEPICEAKFHERSNGFRPNRSTEHALAQCYRMIQMQNLHFVVDIDIKGFFDNVNHSKLIRQMWTMGIRDKRLICIIKQMLKAPIVMPDGNMIYPTKGTPQGGILSPLLANIVLNELDWWISSQWETMPTHKQFKKFYSKNGTETRGNIYKLLRNSNLKEMFIVRYADDFKIFCRKRSDADKIFIAVKKWLKERLKLEISEEKSKVVNLKKRYSEFLGFKLKAVKKADKYVVRSYMSDKAVKCETYKLVNQVKLIQHSKNSTEQIMQIKQYNSMVFGIHNYYRYATVVNHDCMKMQFQISRIMYNRLKGLKKNGIIGRKYIADIYGQSKMMRFLSQEPICPIGYIQTKNPMYKKKKICKYTAEGREEIHKRLKFDESVMTVLHMLAKAVIPNRSIEYMDNRVSLYAAQFGKCAVTGKVLWIDEIHCHHKKPISQGGTDEYKNLVIVHTDVHKLIHAVKPETIQAYLNKIKPTKSQLDKINKFRKTAGNPAIEMF